MVFQPGQQGPGRGGCRQRPALMLPELVVPDGVPLDEYAVPVREAAELTGIKFQGLHAQIERGSVPAYVLDGRRMIRLDDLAETRASQRQVLRNATERHRRGWAVYHLTQPGECRGAGCPHWTHAPAADEPAPAPPPKPKRVYSPARLAQLAAARLVKAAGDVRRRADREQAVAGRAQMGPTE